MSPQVTEAKVSRYKQPKEYRIKSRDWPITAEEASRVLVEAKQIKNNKELYKAALAHLKEKIKTMEDVT